MMCARSNCWSHHCLGFKVRPFFIFSNTKCWRDKRFRQIKTSFPTWLMVWTIQGSWVFITAGAHLPPLLRQLPNVGTLVLRGLVLWVAGFAIEILADRQKTIFRSQLVTRIVLFRVVSGRGRGTNYFGEIVLYLPYCSDVRASAARVAATTLISPLYVVILLTWVSGARMLEREQQKSGPTMPITSLIRHPHRLWCCGLQGGVNIMNNAD